MKFILNITLVPNPNIGVYGAAIGSVACHMIAFLISFTLLRKFIKLELTFSKFVLKPIIAVIIMSICSYSVYLLLNGIIIERLATILAIVVAVIVYAISIIILKIFTKEEIEMLPSGTKIIKILQKIKIY